MADNIHVVPHFHWDREWYFTAEESKILLVNNMEEILTMLETNDDYPYFVMDGQTAILEDYLSVKPEYKDRLKKLVNQGKLIIGPWYTQTDELVVGGESIVRNLLYGKLDCEKFGDRMLIGYLPDSFGQSARLPQILNGFGIDRCMFWRGTSERMGTSKTEFYWEGDCESKVVTQLLPLGYAIGKYLPVDEKGLKERLDKYLPVLDRGATTEHILLPNGHDQMPVQKNIFEVMNQIEKIYPGRKTRISRYEDVFDIIEQNTNLDTIKGEFLDGKYMRVHRSIYSSRADLKSANTRIENKVTNILEPLASIAYSLGFEYHHGLIEEIWKELLKNHAHDSIGCCCSDKVHTAINNRFFIAEDRADNLINFYKRKIADSIGETEGVDTLTVFNTLPYERKEVVIGEIITKMQNFSLVDEKGTKIDFEVLESDIIDAGLIDRQIVHYGNYDPFIKYIVALEDTIPAMGYKTYTVTECTESMHKYDAKVQEGKSIENDYYKIDIQENGTLVVKDKNTGNVYNNVFLLEDGSDDGDGYDFSPLENDFVILSSDVEADIKIEKYKHNTKAEIALTMNVPKDLESRKERKIDGFLDVKFNIELRNNSPIIQVVMEVNNQAKDHRLRLLIPNNLKGSLSISDNQFGVIKRPVIDEAMEVWEKEKWSERPDSIYPFLSFVKEDCDEGLAFLSNSVREYEVIGEKFDTIAITIFRGVGVLGKENLQRRPGRPSGIKMETPDSQMLGYNSYEFAITSDCNNAQLRAKEYISPLCTYNKTQYNAMKLNPSGISVPLSYSLIKLDNKAITLSVLKKEEQGKGLLLRCYNATDNILTGRLETEYNCIGEVRLDETNFLASEKSDVLSLNPNQTTTIVLNK